MERTVTFVFNENRTLIQDQPAMPSVQYLQETAGQFINEYFN